MKKTRMNAARLQLNKESIVALSLPQVQSLVGGLQAGLAPTLACVGGEEEGEPASEASTIAGSALGTK